MLLDLRSLYEVGSGVVVGEGPAATLAPRVGRPISRTRTIHSWSGKLRAGTDSLAAVCTRRRIHVHRGQLAAATDQLGAADALRSRVAFMDHGRLISFADRLAVQRSIASGLSEAERQRLMALDDDWIVNENI